MNTSIIHWPEITILNLSLQTFDHTTMPSFLQQSSIDYIGDNFSQTDPSEASKNNLDESWTGAGPYDDDEEDDLKECV